MGWKFFSASGAIKGQGTAGADGAAGTSRGAFTWMTRPQVQAGVGRRFYIPRAGTFVGVYLWATDNAPTGTATFDVLLNGTSIFGANPKPTITSGNYVGTEVTAFGTATFAAGDKIEVQVISAGGVTSGRMGCMILYTYT